ncbi:MAG: hypothetical protein FWC57_05100, partial [Endomicrobia bacterium]|nr:hypothetical protein [Endomicrobiia bacterium]
MWKIFRYIIYICVIFAVFAAAYNIRTVLVVPKVEKYIYANTGRKVSIGNFSFNPLRLAITAENVTLGNNISAKEIVISLNPLKIIQNIRSPLNYISRVGLYGVAVSIPDSDYIPLVPASQDAPAAGFAFMLPRSGMDIFINDAVISRGGAKAEVSGGRLNLHRDGAEFSSAVSVRGITFNVSAQMNRKDGQIFDSSASITSNEFLESSINMSGQIDLSDLSFSQKVEADNVKFRAFETGYMSGMITRDSGSISGALDGEFGSVEIYYCAKDGFSATVKADLSKMNGDVKGLLDFKLKQAEEEGDIALKINDLSVFNFGLGSFCVTGVRRFNGDLEFSADYGNRNRLAGNYLRNGEYELNIMSADKLAGRLSGNFRKSTIDADIKNIDLAKMPVAPFLGDKAKGKLSVTGSINENSGKINMEILGLETPQIDKTDIFGLIARQGDINVFNFYKSDNSVVFNTVVQSGKVLSTDFKFLNTGLANVFRVFGYAQSGISGTANGRIKYERNGTTEFDIKAFDGVFFDNKFARLEAKGDVNLRRVNISYFLLKDETGAARMSVSGLLGFTGDTPASSLSINLKDIKAGPAVINTDASFSGTLNNKNEINGRFESKEINVSGVPFKNFYAASMMSVKKFEISDMTADNGLGGDFSADFVKKSLKGFLSLSDTDFSGINPALSGLITASVKVSGGFSAPSLTVSASVKKGAYAQIPFTLFSDIV